MTQGFDLKAFQAEVQKELVRLPATQLKQHILQLIREEPMRISTIDDQMQHVEASEKLHIAHQLEQELPEFLMQSEQKWQEHRERKRREWQENWEQRLRRWQYRLADTQQKWREELDKEEQRDLKQLEQLEQAWVKQERQNWSAEQQAWKQLELQETEVQDWREQRQPKSELHELLLQMEILWEERIDMRLERSQQWRHLLEQLTQERWYLRKKQEEYAQYIRNLHEQARLEAASSRFITKSRSKSEQEKWLKELLELEPKNKEWSRDQLKAETYEQLKERREQVSEEKAKEILERKDIRAYLCPALESSSNDVFTIANTTAQVLVPLILAGTLAIPLIPVLFASIALLISRIGIASWCTDYKKDKK